MSIVTMRILVVDDDENIRRILKLMLKDHEVLEASNGREAIEMFKRFRPEIVMMDVIMPDMDGVEATKEIVKIDPNAVVIGVTAFARNRGSEMISAGAAEVIEKPFSKKEICRIVEKYAVVA